METQASMNALTAAYTIEILLFIAFAIAVKLHHVNKHRNGLISHIVTDLVVTNNTDLLNYRPATVQIKNKYSPSSHQWLGLITEGRAMGIC